MILINIPGVLIASINKGAEADYLARTGGYDVIIEGAKKADMRYFEEVEGITYTVRDDGVYIKISDSVDKEYTVNHISYINNANKLHFEVRSYMISKTAPRELITLMNGVKVLFTIVGMISIYFAYALNFQKRRSELRTLIRFGISRKDLFVTLILELAAIFLPALPVAVVISNLSVYLIIKIFFTASDYYTQIIYSYDIPCFISLFICSFLAAVAAFYLSWRKIVSGLFGDYFEKEKHHSRFINEKISDKPISPEKFIVSVNLFREVEYSVPRGIVAFITVIIVTFAALMNGLISNDYADYDIVVMADISQIHDRADEINAAYDELTALSNISGVDTDYSESASDVNSKVPRVFYITLDENCDTQSVEEELHRIFKDESLFTISDYYRIKAEQKSNDRVIKAIVMLMAISMAVCGFLLTYVFSSLIGLKNVKVNRQMIRFGVPRNSLVNSAGILAFIRSTVVCVCGIAVSLVAASVVSYASGVRLGLTLTAVTVGIVLIAAMFLTHIIPELFYIKAQTRSEE